MKVPSSSISRDEGHQSNTEVSQTVQQASLSSFEGTSEAVQETPVSKAVIVQGIKRKRGEESEKDSTERGEKRKKHKHSKKSNKDGNKKRKEGRTKSKNKPVILPSSSSTKDGEHQPNPEVPETIKQASLPSKGTSYMPSSRKQLIHSEFYWSSLLEMYVECYVVVVRTVVMIEL